MDAICLLDSGADITLLNRDLAAALGIDMTTKPLRAKALAGDMRVIRSSVQLILCDKVETCALTIPILVNLDLTNEVEVVLGRAGVFTRFRITFAESHNAITMSREEERTSGYLQEDIPGKIIRQPDCEYILEA